MSFAYAHLRRGTAVQEIVVSSQSNPGQGTGPDLPVEEDYRELCS